METNLNHYIDTHSRLGPGRAHERRSIEETLTEMDDLGIWQTWICPTDAFAAVRNSEGNRFIAGAVRAHPERFVGCAVANPWFEEEAIATLHQAFDGGLRVLYLCPPVQGFQLSDPLVDPLVETAMRFNAPVYAHTGTPVCAMPFQLSALARRHPDVRFIMGHSGYSDFWYDTVAAAKSAKNIWLETSFIDGDILLRGVETLGAEKLVFGTSAPLSDRGPELEKIKAMNLENRSFDRIMFKNARVLLS